jgi:hydrogenase-1 operon protein HyaF
MASRGVNHHFVSATTGCIERDAMSGLGDIAVAVEITTGNVTPLLHEVRHALQRLLDTGEPTVIDLHSLPLAPGELAALENELGEGEVSATLNALGPSLLRETAVPGVWFVTHRNANEEITGQYLEIVKIPAILEDQEVDIRLGIAALSENLEQTKAQVHRDTQDGST